MFLFDFFRSFLPLHNPIGFGAVDFIEFALVAVLVSLVLLRARMEPAFQRLAARTGWCMLLLAALPVALRLLLLPRHPVPMPAGADGFSYVLLADTLRHFRLANPPHALHQFFETVFVLQEPSYSSIYPLGQGLALALGWTIFGHPWAGVVLSVAALCSLCYWMLRGWTTPGWALVGGLLAVIEFGPLNEWMNIYWGGAVAAAAGCLVFGALPRLRQEPRTRDAVWLGLGLAVHLLTRPYESIFLLVSVILFFLPALRARGQRAGLVRAAAAVALVVLPAIALTLLHNRAVTGSWTTMPYALSRYQYGVPTTFTFQSNPIPHRPLTAQQRLTYEGQAEVHGEGADTIGRYFERFGSRARYYRFFFLAPLYLALPAFLVTLREFRFGWIPLTLLVFGLGGNFYPYFFPQYIAAATCLLLLIGVTGLERLSRWTVRGFVVGQDAARLLIFLCAAHFLFWYGLHLFANDNLLLAMGRYETWDYINYGDAEGRISISHRLAQAPGKQLVFVRYGPQHRFREWVHNAADIDSAPVVWALDLGPGEDEKLERYYPDRTVWLVEPDARPPKLMCIEAFSHRRSAVSPTSAAER
ncbi:MAG: hypothetical protein ABSH44_23620 [Bryobacteraceae bacterium]|jgi:hypothetical protein